MLQQTQVQTVGPYFRRWMKAFPSFRALATASRDEVLKCWEGLGYYTRARNMHAAAKIVSGDLAGRMPRTVEQLRKLPGIGPYTAGAIASIAFGADEPVLDGNVIRVLCRLVGLRRNPADTAVRRELWRLAGELIPPGRAGDFNEAMMDLGATVCTPASPDCPTCPLRTVCIAREKGLQAELPVKPPRRKPPHYDIAVGVVIKAGKVLIARRKPDAMLGGLWEFPGGKMQPNETAAQAAVREVREEVGIDVAADEAPFATVRHAYSHFHITLRAVVCQHVRGRPKAIGCDVVRWVAAEELDGYAFPRANQKVLARLKDLI
jgi:A/G-specific adenine glycosylase